MIQFTGPLQSEYFSGLWSIVAFWFLCITKLSFIDPFTLTLKFMKSRTIKLLASILIICGIFSVASVSKVEVADGKIWLGIGYLAAKKGASAEAGLAVGSVGLLHTTIHSIAWGAAFGGPAGAAAGLVVGV